MHGLPECVKMSFAGGLNMAENVAEVGNKHTEVGPNHSTTNEGGGSRTELGHNHSTNVIVYGRLSEVGSNLAKPVPNVLKKKV